MASEPGGVMMVGTKRAQRFVVAGLMTTTLGLGAGIATAASASAAGPTAPHGAAVGDGGQGAKGEAGNVGGCIHTRQGSTIIVNRGPFTTVACFVP